MTELHFQPAHELAHRIVAKEICAVELLEHYLKRIEAHNPQLNAIIWMDAERAREMARRVDAAIARGDDLGPFAGVPLTLKESFQVAGTPTTWGIPNLAGSVTDTTALAAERLIEAGIVFVGKTNVPIHLADWQSFNAIYGTTRNPWNQDMTPGGSSGGSVAALAAGMTALEAGSDIGASIRNPAHYCGVFGLKPTYGLIPPRGQALPGIVAPADISVVGPLTRSARDLEIALFVMAGPDPLDDAAWRLELVEPPQKALRDFRVAVKLDDPNSEVDRAYQNKLQALVDALAKAGATVSDKARPEIDTCRLHEVYIRLLRAATSGRMPDSDVERWQKVKSELSPEDKSYLAQMARGNSLRRMRRARDRRLRASTGLRLSRRAFLVFAFAAGWSFAANECRPARRLCSVDRHQPTKSRHWLQASRRRDQFLAPLDHDYSADSGPDPGTEAFDTGNRSQNELSLDGRCVQRIVPAHSREHGVL